MTRLTIARLTSLSSVGGYDAQLFTNDSEKLGVALGQDVSHRSGLAPEANLTINSAKAEDRA
jgi:hypothetical protein